MGCNFSTQPQVPVNSTSSKPPIIKFRNAHPVSQVQKTSLLKRGDIDEDTRSLIWKLLQNDDI